LGGAVTGPASGDTDGDGALDPTETWTYTAAYLLTQTDIDTGQVNNLATVIGEDPEGRTTTDASTDPTPCTTCAADPTCADCTLTELPDSYVDIALTKTVDIGLARVGDEVNFTITASNLGTAIASDISISEMLPDGFEYSIHATTLGNYDQTMALWSIPALGPGEVAELSISVVLVDGNDYLNIAILVDIEQEDIDPSNDEASVEVEIDEPLCPINVYNVLSPNGDGVHDVFQIACIENYPNNSIQIFNRWGIEVFKQEGYNNTWGGNSDGRSTYDKNEKLPVGTYFYILDLGDGTMSRTGYLYLTR